MNWQPNPEWLAGLVALLKNTQVNDSNVQRNIFELKNEPDFVRAAAGYLLKNNVKEQFKRLPHDVQEFIKLEVLSCIGDGSTDVRNAVGTIVTTIVVQAGGLNGWPSLLQTLVQLIDSNNPIEAEGAFQALTFLCEDYGHKMDDETLGRPLNYLIPKLISLLHSPHSNFRIYALRCLHQFIVDLPGALLVAMDQYIQTLLGLSNDQVGEVRGRMIGSLVLLAEVKADYHDQ